MPCILLLVHLFLQIPQTFIMLFLRDRSGLQEPVQCIFLLQVQKMVLLFMSECFPMGASESTSNIFKSWCKMLGGHFVLLIMNAWCLRLFVSMVGNFLANPLSV